MRVNGLIVIAVVFIAILNSNVTAEVIEDDVEVAVDSVLAGKIEMTKIRKFLESREKLKAKHPNGPDVDRQ